MVSAFGEVLVAEQVPCKISLGNGISIVENVKRDITAMSTSYPFSSVLRNRFKREDRVEFLGLEIRHAQEQKEQEQKIEPMHHELSQDLRKLAKGKMWFGGK